MGNKPGIPLEKVAKKIKTPDKTNCKNPWFFDNAIDLK